ncbi:hypothetical protein IHE45_10G051800 [Dioscorea alata]|uniref:Uncharacterized protein n=1 Tax=Dioscorea alata TaxID=55571 RepID=A0ACB7VAU6_DIOAL|nr:hypothetical protein IHE45_10G051800 [Dioscorea alata]
MMEERRRRRTSCTSAMEVKRAQTAMNDIRAFPWNYFSSESCLLFVCLTASLLILPLILPPLPPPPIMLLLLPIGILLVLLLLGFMPSDVRDIASSYL